MNILFINKNIEEHNIFVDSANGQTKNIIFDPSIDTYQSILDSIVALGDLEQMQNIALVSHGVKPRGEYKLLDNETPITFERTKIEVDDTSEITKKKVKKTRKKVYEGWNNFVIFLKSIKTNLVNLKNFDLLGCALLSYSTWKKVLQYVETESGINIRASDDDTGNLKVGANWVLESDNVNIKDLYFTEKIENLTTILGTPNPNINLEASKYFQYSKNGGTIVITEQDVTSLNLTKNGSSITGGDTSGNRLKCSKIVLENDLTIDGSGNTFDPSGNNTISLKGSIIFDGNGNQLILNNCDNWVGFIQSDSESFKTRPIIRNLDISGNSNTNLKVVSYDGDDYGSSYLLKYNSLYFEVDNCSNNLIIDTELCGGLIPSNEDLTDPKGIVKNCYNTGDISEDKTGGICGYNVRNITITNCYNTGNISGDYAGGICGEDASGNIITNCYNTGNISGEDAGGICGEDATENIITNCHNTGDISEDYAGGICGWGASGNIITNCYNTGDINGVDAGGICGEEATENIITNCYNTGDINAEEAGGICGEEVLGNIITNCYNTGDISESDAGGICGYKAKNNIITNCHNTGDINGDSGGITGPESVGCIFINCYNTGNINGNSDDEFGGGITGYGITNSQFINCYNTGNINGKQGGGIIGDEAYEVGNVLINCYNTGDINAEEAGGLIGEGVNCLIYNCFSVCNITSSNNGALFGINNEEDAELNVYNSFSYVLNDTSGSNTSIMPTVENDGNDQNIFLYNVKSNKSNYLYDCSANTINIAGSTILSVDASNNGTGGTELATNTASQIAQLLKNKDNVNSWVLNPKGAKYADPEKNFMKQVRVPIPGTDDFFPILKSNNLTLTKNKLVIPTYEGYQYEFSNVKNVNVKNGSIVITRKNGNLKNGNLIKKVLFNNTTGCKRIVNCGKKNKSGKGSFDTTYDVGRNVQDTTNARTQGVGDPVDTTGNDVTESFNINII